MGGGHDDPFVSFVSTYIVAALLLAFARTCFDKADEGITGYLCCRRRAYGTAGLVHYPLPRAAQAQSTVSVGCTWAWKFQSSHLSDSGNKLVAGSTRLLQV